MVQLFSIELIQTSVYKLFVIHRILIFNTLCSGKFKRNGKKKRKFFFAKCTFHVVLLCIYSIVFQKVLDEGV